MNTAEMYLRLQRGAQERTEVAQAECDDLDDAINAEAIECWHRGPESFVAFADGSILTNYGDVYQNCEALRNERFRQ